MTESSISSVLPNIASVSNDGQVENHSTSNDTNKSNISQDSTYEADACAICKIPDGIEPKQWSTLGCGHTFHSDCVATWVGDDAPVAATRGCPSCRARISMREKRALSRVLHGTSHLYLEHHHMINPLSQIIKVLWL